MSDEFNNGMGKGDVTDDDKLWAGLSLAIPIVGVIALLMEDKKSRPFIRHAAWHGIAIGVVGIILAVIPVVQCVTGIISLLLWVYGIYLGWQAYSEGAWANIPGVTDLLKGQGWV